MLLASKTLDGSILQAHEAQSKEAQSQHLKMTAKRPEKKTDEVSSSVSNQHTPNKHLSNTRKNEKMAALRKKLKLQVLLSLRLSQMLARTKGRKKRLADKISMYSKRGNVSVIIENLHRAFDKGCLRGKSNTLKFLKNVPSNLTRSTHGKCYSKAAKCLYDALRIIGGPRSAWLLAYNLKGPSEYSQTRSCAKHKFNHKPLPPNAITFKHIAKMYEEIMKSKKMSGPVLVKNS